jgi:hypothetical protein
VRARTRSVTALDSSLLRFTRASEAVIRAA